ncbi:hypothetical protein L198_02421 [Cryptococcus wingfieldii CBS 7118]|uniref:Uncharacterized protein n=1 Tax=Cryptococcus wingfieldii CBS 7118 TaxID=1295528 RepID=A0A1E3JRX0_9TREE|nr:hypothetical protein L198_02421 [Cryptococcus wingfieldii CBS 7118]ODO03573.1 hypothetical protein L198_02421 [Cryptococcus wingfieldii CBS 7118]
MTASVRSWATVSSSDDSSSDEDEQPPAFISVPNPTLDGSCFEPPPSNKPYKAHLAGGEDGWQNIATAADGLTSRYRCDDDATWNIEIPTEAGDKQQTLDLMVGRGHDGVTEAQWLELARSSVMKNETEKYPDLGDAVESAFPNAAEALRDEVVNKVTKELQTFRNLALAPHYDYFVDSTDSESSEDE